MSGAMGLHVVETTRDRFLGTVEVQADGRLIVRSGFVGHPVTVHPHEVVEVIAAEDHPDVVVA